MNSYWEVFDPLDKQDKEAGYGSVAGDLAEIYDDLNDGLQLYIAGHVAEAVWDWRFGFDTHWGRHLTSALRAIYSYFS